jgi:hypothetical protein
MHHHLKLQKESILEAFTADSHDSSTHQENAVMYMEARRNMCLSDRRLQNSIKKQLICSIDKDNDDLVNWSLLNSTYYYYW